MKLKDRKIPIWRVTMFAENSKDSGFKFVDGPSVHRRVGDSEVICSLIKSGVDYPTIFSLVWGRRMGYNKVLFTEELAKTVLSIEECIRKKEEAFDIQEQKIQSIMLDLLQMLYEKQVNDIAQSILGV